MPVYDINKFLTYSETTSLPSVSIGPQINNPAFEGKLNEQAPWLFPGVIAIITVIIAGLLFGILRKAKMFFPPQPPTRPWINPYFIILVPRVCAFPPLPPAVAQLLLGPLRLEGPGAIRCICSAAKCSHLNFWNFTPLQISTLELYEYFHRSSRLGHWILCTAGSL